MENLEFRLLVMKEIDEALNLAWQVFLEFEAPEYDPEGVEEFHRFVQPENIDKIISGSGFLVWGCLDDGKVVGMLGVRGNSHISLLFVHPDYHRRGIAKGLMNELTNFSSVTGTEALTVNASPYAVEIYAKMGFVATAEEQLENGIRYTPMVKHLNPF